MKKFLLGLAITCFSASAISAELVTECQDYFKEADAVLETSLAAAKAQGVDPDQLKKQYEDSKAQFAALSADQQKSLCKQALDAIEQAKQAEAIK